MITTYQATHVTPILRNYLKDKYRHPLRSAYRDIRRKVLWDVDVKLLAVLADYWKREVKP